MAASNNIDRVLRQWTDYKDGIMDGVVEAQRELANRVLARAIVYCPRETGALRASGKLAAEKREPALTSIDVVFGGPEAPHATIVHEDLSARHDPPTQAKYLERAVDEIAPEMTLRIGEASVAAAKRRAR